MKTVHVVFAKGFVPDLGGSKLERLLDTAHREYQTDAVIIDGAAATFVADGQRHTYINVPIHITEPA